MGLENNNISMNVRCWGRGSKRKESGRETRDGEKECEERNVNKETREKREVEEKIGRKKKREKKKTIKKDAE